MNRKKKAALSVALLTAVSVIFSLGWTLSNVGGAVKYLTTHKSELMKLNYVQFVEVQHPFNAAVFGMLFILLATMLGGHIIRDILEETNNDNNNKND